MRRTIPFIFMSGYDDEQTRNLVVNPAIDFFFSKTTPIDKVLALIETLNSKQRITRAGDGDPHGLSKQRLDNPAPQTGPGRSPATAGVAP